MVRGFDAGVRELDAGDGTVLCDEVCDCFELGDVFIFPDAEAVRRDASTVFDTGCFEDDESCAADGPRSVVNAVPFIGKAVDG